MSAPTPEREGEYIYRLVDQMARGAGSPRQSFRVWNRLTDRGRDPAWNPRGKAIIRL